MKLNIQHWCINGSACVSVTCIWWSHWLTCGHAVMSSQFMALCGFRGGKNRPAPFPGRMSWKLTKPGLALSVIYFSMLYVVLLFIRAPFCVLFCYTPLTKPNHGKGIVFRKPGPKSDYDFLSLLYCFIVLLCICVVSWPYRIYFPTSMVRYSLFVLKVPLNTKQTCKQTNKQTNKQTVSSLYTHWSL